MKRILLLLVAICGLVSLQAATIDTLQIHSAKMDRGIKTLIIVPEQAATESVPTLYLLHGFSGKEYSWMSLRDLRPIADQYGMLIVCPYGENSWYWDSPINPSSQFETFITSELVAYVDKNYPTVADRTGRAIAGLSMGGQGAMWSALHHRDVYGAVGSISGGLDIRPFPEKWKMKEQLGPKDQNSQRWDDHAAINAIGDLKNNELAMIIDCGVDDFFIDVNRNFHNALVEKGISHDYIERAGAHTGVYWRNSIVYQTFFFHQYFSTHTKVRQRRAEAAQTGIATIENGYLTVEINKKGAELRSIKRDLTGHEYLWQGDPTYWKFRSPVLFPIVGSVTNNTYRQDCKEYNLTIHGLARDYDFEIVKHNQTEVVYQLRSNEEMRKRYPYDFMLEIGYKLSGDNITVSYRVVNPSDETMHFQLGSHPGFNYKDYNPEATVQAYYQFNDREDSDKLIASMSSADGYLKAKQKIQLTDKMMPITKNTFDKGALTLENNQTQDVTLLDGNKQPYVRVRSDAPVMGLWSGSNNNYVPFVCIEPWYGRGDVVNYKGEFADKEWMQTLPAKESFKTKMVISLFK